jgi:hypothetical protein
VIQIRTCFICRQLGLHCLLQHEGNQQDMCHLHVRDASQAVCSGYLHGMMPQADLLVYVQCSAKFCVFAQVRQRRADTS